MGNSLCYEAPETPKPVLTDVFKYKIQEKYSNLAVFHSQVYFLDYSNVINIDNPIMELDINCEFDKKIHHLNFDKKIIKQKYSLPITEYNLMDWVLDILTNLLYQMNLDSSLFFIQNDEIVIKKYQDKPHYTCVINLVRK